MTTPVLSVLDPTAAAVDVGSGELHASIAGGLPKILGTTTGQLHALRDWLKENAVRTARARIAQARFRASGARPPAAGLSALAHRPHHDGRQPRAVHAKGAGADKSEDPRISSMSF